MNSSEPDRYEILERIGAGAMGVVYRARDRVLDRMVALKVLGPHVRPSQRARERFRREMQAISRLDHPNVVRLYHADGEGENPRYSMELVSGSTLAAIVAAVHPMTGLSFESCSTLAAEVGRAGHEAVARVLGALGNRRWSEALCRWMAQVADGLDHAHHANLIHRDVKPSNVLIGEDGNARIADFGVAVLTDDEPASRTAAGTPEFAAPELLASRRVDTRADVFSIGRTLEVALAQDRPPSRDLAAVIRKARSDEPEDRYTSASELARDLERVLMGDEVLARPPSVLRRAVRTLRRNPRVVVAVMLVLTALGVATQRTLASRRTQIHAEAQLQSESDKLAALIDERDTLIRQRQFMTEEMTRLQAATVVRRLHEEVDTLWPVLPSRIDAMFAWRLEAEEHTDPSVHRDFLDRLHDQVLQEQRVQGLVADDATDPDWDLADPVARWFQRHVQDVIGDIRQLQQDVEQVDRRIARAEELEQLTLVDIEDEWEDAITEIFISDRYDGLEIEPQEGLVPLGFDPDSGLFEFWDCATGARPEADEEGRHRVDEDSGLVLVLIPGGTFTLGAERPGGQHQRGDPHVDSWANSGSSPVHDVTLAPFLISKYEMTQAQWRRLTGLNPSHFQQGKAAWFDADERHPVESILWSDAVGVLARIGLQLPTEAQWETAARAGTTTPFITGESPRSLEGHANFLDRAGRRNPAAQDQTFDREVDDGHAGTAPVGSFLPNGFGLFDTAGNVSELCRDRMVRFATPVMNEEGEREGGDRERYAIRGQSYYVAAQYGGVARREVVEHDESSSSVGVRPGRALRVPE